MIGYSKNMKVFLLILFSVFFSASFCGAETVYKTVDENGHIIFTDKPTQGSEEIKLKELQTIENPNPAKYKPLPKKTSKAESGNIYKSLLVTNPADGSGLRSNAGDVSISLSLQPGLRPGHTMTISLDGKEISSGNNLSVTLNNVERGAHKIEAKVFDVNGKQLISTTSSFSLLRAHK